MPGVTFDRAVSFYDATRAFPEGVDEQLRNAVLERLGTQAQGEWIELGIGTGRVAMPFIEAGCRFTGVDLSLAMMQYLQQKLQARGGQFNCRLIQGDVMRLPLQDASFDVVLMVHVLHLVDDWQQTLREVARILRPDGTLILIDNDRGRARNPEATEANLTQLVGARWNAILRDLGYQQPVSHNGIRALDTPVLELLHDLGCQTELTTLVEYREQPLTIRTVAERRMARIFSSDWDIPDDIHALAVPLLQRWLDELPNPDEPHSGTGHIRALIARQSA